MAASKLSRTLLLKPFNVLNCHPVRHAVTVDRSTVYKLFRATANAYKAGNDDARKIATNKIEVNDIELQYEITGAGRNVLLLLPGALGCSRTDFQRQLSGINKDLFTVIAWDPRGYGGSIPPERDWPEQFFERDADDAVQLMKNLGIDRYSLLGWSDGGITALIMAARQPEHVQKLVVWGANSYVTDGEIEVYEKIRDVSKWRQSMLRKYLEVYSQDYLQLHFSKWVDALKAYKTKRNGDICKADLEKIKCPTLILHGEKDVLVPRFHSDFLVDKIRNASLKTFADGRHNVHEQYYQLFNSIVQHFLVQPLNE